MKQRKCRIWFSHFKMSLKLVQNDFKGILERTRIIADDGDKPITMFRDWDIGRFAFRERVTFGARLLIRQIHRKQIEIISNSSYFGMTVFGNTRSNFTLLGLIFTLTFQLSEVRWTCWLQNFRDCFLLRMIKKKESFSPCSFWQAGFLYVFERIFDLFLTVTVVMIEVEVAK